MTDRSIIVTLQAMKKENFLLIAILLIFVVSLGVLASDMYLPSLPAIAVALHISKSTVQLTITYYLLALALSQLFYGPLSDRFGRRNTLLLGISICLVGSVICVFARTGEELILGRIIQGAGAGSSSSLFRSIMRDTFSGIELVKVAGWASIAFTVAPAVAPIIGGYIETYFGWRTTFLFLALYILLSLFVVKFYLKETNKNLNPHATHLQTLIKNYRTILTDARFIGYSICTMVVTCGLFAYLTASPFLFEQVLKLSPVAYGWTALFCIFASITGKLLNTWLIGAIDGKKLMQIGIFTMLLSGLAMILTVMLHWVNVAAIIVPAMIYIFAGGFIFTNSMTGALAPFSKMAGSAAALYSFLQTSGGFIGSAILSCWHTHNQLPLAAVFTALAVIAALVFYLFVLQENVHEEITETVSRSNA